MALVYFLLIIAFCAAVGVPVYFYARHHTRRRTTNASRTLILKITFPRGDFYKTATPDLRSEIQRFENFLKRLFVVKKQFALEVFVEHLGTDISFRVALPKNLRAPVEDEIHGTWRGVRVEAVHDDAHIFSVHGTTLAGYLRQKKDFAFPLPAHHDLDADFFSGVIEVLGGVGKIGEGAAVQFLLRPASRATKNAISRHISLFARKGLSAESLSEGLPFSASDNEKFIHLLRRRAFRHVFEVNARIVVSAGNRLNAEGIFDAIAKKFEGLRFAGGYRNALKVVRLHDPSLIVRKFVSREFDHEERLALSGEEVTTLFHFPTSAIAGGNVKRLGSRDTELLHASPARGLLLGEHSFRGQTTAVRLSNEDRKKGIFIVGKKGVGVSALLLGMMRQDIEGGRGLCFIDPDGEIAERVASMVPRERMGDVICIDAGGTRRLASLVGGSARPLGGPVRINLIDRYARSSEEKRLLAEELRRAMSDLFSLESRGPIFDDFVRNAVTLLVDSSTEESATLTDFLRIFTDKAYRHKKLAHTKNHAVINFWEHEARSARGEAAFHGVISQMVSKVGELVHRDPMRRIFSGGDAGDRRVFDATRAIKEKKIILCSLRRDLVGESHARFLGVLVATKILMAGMFPEKDPRSKNSFRFTLYADQAEFFRSGLIAPILAGHKKSAVDLALAARSLGGVSEELKKAIVMGVISKIAFRLDHHDVEMLLSDFKDAFTKEDLVNIEKLHAHARLVVHGIISAPFSFRVRTDSWYKKESM